MNKRKEYIGFCLIIILAAVLRFAGISFDSLWLDEGYQSLVGAYGHGAPDFSIAEPKNFLFKFENAAPPSAVLSNFRKVDPLCPPLYALLLNRWLTIVGDSDLQIRALSLLISTSSIAALMLFARALFGWNVALLAGLLQAVSPFDIHYAQEARMYSLVVLNAVLSGGSLLCFLKNELQNKRDYLVLVLYSVSTFALVNSHYTGLFLALTEGISVLAYTLFCKKWKLLLAYLLACFFTAIMCLPWLPLFLQSASSRKESFYVAREANLIWPFKALLRVFVNWLVFLSGQRVVAYAAPLYVSSAVMLIASAYGAARVQLEERRWLLSLFVWALLPALGIWLVDLIENHKVVEVSRYLIFTAPAVYLLAAWGYQHLRLLRKPFLVLLYLHLIFASVNLYYTHTVHQREPWQEMAKKVDELVPEDQTLVISQYYDIACLDRYLTRPRVQMGISPSMGNESIVSCLQKLDSFALLSAQDGESVTGMIPASFKLKQKVDMSHGLHLRLYER